jgi:hypothetical protein
MIDAWQRGGRVRNGKMTVAGPSFCAKKCLEEYRNRPFWGLRPQRMGCSAARDTRICTYIVRLSAPISSCALDLLVLYTMRYAAKPILGHQRTRRRTGGLLEAAWNTDGRTSEGPPETCCGTRYAGAVFQHGHIGGGQGAKKRMTRVDNKIDNPANTVQE